MLAVTSGVSTCKLSRGKGALNMDHQPPSVGDALPFQGTPGVAGASGETGPKGDKVCGWLTTRLGNITLLNARDEQPCIS